MNSKDKKNIIGMICVIVAFGFVAIVTMILCKSMFDPGVSESQRITGVVTSTQYNKPATADSQENSKDDNSMVVALEDESETENSDSEQESSSLLDEDATEMTVKQAVYMRTAPNKNSDNIATLSSGTVVAAYETEGGWVHVKYGDLDGYVYNTFLTE